MIFTDSLYSLEAEQNVLGFFFNEHINEDKRLQVLQLVQPEHFTGSKAEVIYGFVKKFQIFDKIVLWEKIKRSKTIKDIGVEWSDIENIDDFVKPEDIDSYVEILLDKHQKRELHKFGLEISEAMLKGEDQFEIALRANNVLSRMSSKINLQTNQELLDTVLTEQASDVISTGFDAIDKFLGGFARGMIVTIAGDSGHLKTTLALEQAFRMAEKNPKLKIGIFSKEMTAETLMKKQISRICGIPTSLIFSKKYDKEFVRKKMMEIPAWRDNRIRIINPNTFTGVGDIARIQMTHRFDIWFLDFIQLLEFAKAVSSSSDYNVQIGQNMRNLQSLSLTTKSVGIVISQVKKGIEYRKNKKPTISDLEWSGLIKQLSAYIIFSYYPGKYYGWNKMPQDHYYLLGEKTRFAETFIYPMEVNPELGIFKEIQDQKIRKKMLDELTQLLGE
jgi:replicative DNA helicase